MGLILPLSGPRADAGAYILNAATLASEALRKDGVDLSLIVDDSHYDPKTAVASLQKLLTKPVKYVLSGGSSSEVLAMAPITEARKVIMLVPGAQSEEIATAGELIFRFMHNTAQEPAFFGPEMAKRMRGEKLAIFAAQFAATEPYLQRLIPILEQNGKMVVVREEFDVNCTDFRSQLMKVKASGAKDLYLMAPAAAEAYAIVQARQLHLDLQFFAIGMESPDFLRIAGPNAEGLIYSYSFYSQVSGAVSAAFVEEYKKRFNIEPEAIAANTYDALKLLAGCAGKSSATTGSVAKCLYAVKDYRGVGGTFSILPTGDAEKQLFLKTVKNGRYCRLD